MSLQQAIIFLLCTLVGFAGSMLYSGLETGLYTLNPVRLTLRASRGEGSALQIRHALRHLSRTLSVILIGNNAANYLGTFGLAALMAGLGLTDWAVIVLQAVVVAPALFVIGETLPKELFRRHTDHWTYWLIPMILISRWAFSMTLLLPTVQAFAVLMNRLAGAHDARAATARQRVSQMIKEGVGAGVLSEAQTTLADRALTMRDRRVGSVMVPWREVVALPRSADRERREALMRGRNFTRLPVVDDRGRAVGVISWIDAVLEREAPTRRLLGPAITFAPRTRVLEAITRLRREQQAMGIIIAPQTGRPLGIVTLKDLVEPLTGELAAW
ncbi:MAG: CNNM domain-containing protein [Planctomycetota bacterium]|nr:CNNM domain-containing protein [Planctomycetota bacterium]